jgi:hypothetical protein
MQEPPTVGDELVDTLLKHLHRPDDPQALCSVTVIKPEKVDGEIRLKLTSDDLYILLPDLHLPVVAAPTPRIKEVREYRYYHGESIPYVRRVVDDGLASKGRSPYNQGSPNTIRWFGKYFRGDIFGKEAAVDLDLFLRLLNSFEKKEHIHLVQLGDMYELWLGFKRYFAESEESKPQVIARPGRIDSMTAAEFISYWVRTTNSNSICAQVIKAFENLNVKSKTWLYGNHDNYLALPSVTSGQFPARFPQYRVGGLLMEHGHAPDPHNRDGAISGHKWTNRNFNFPVLRSFDPSRRWLWLTHAALLWAAKPDFAIYAMAHTHSPFLTKLKVRGNAIEDIVLPPPEQIYEFKKHPPWGVL